MSGIDTVLQSVPVVGTYADAGLRAAGITDGKTGSGSSNNSAQQKAQQQAAAQQQSQSIGAVPGTFNANTVANNTLLSGPFSDFAQLGLPTSDQQMISELGSTSLFVGVEPSFTDRLAAGSELPGRPSTGTAPVYKSAADLLKELETSDRQTVISLQQKLIAGQWLPSSYTPNGIVDAPTEAAYLKLLTTAARYQDAGVQLSPDQLLNNSANGSGTGITQTSTVVDLSDPLTARGVANSMFQQILGRAPTSGDISGFVQALQGYEEQNPATTTTTSTIGAGGQVTKQKSTEKTGGASSSLSLRGGDVAAAQEYIDKTHGGEEAQVGIDTLTSLFSQMMGLGNSA